jgi:caa(3)-type oxidase subunit IV
MSAHAHADTHAPHRNYVKIWAILVGLLVVSVTGPMLGIRLVTLITAFGIAVVKAFLVAKNFMHLDIEKPIIRWLLAVGVALMVLLYAGVSPDIERSAGERWKKGPGFHPKDRVGHLESAEHGAAPGHEGAPAATGEPAPAGQDSAHGSH